MPPKVRITLGLVAAVGFIVLWRSPGHAGNNRDWPVVVAAVLVAGVLYQLVRLRRAAANRDAR